MFQIEGTEKVARRKTRFFTTTPILEGATNSTHFLRRHIHFLRSWDVSLTPDYFLARTHPPNTRVWSRPSATATFPAVLPLSKGPSGRRRPLSANLPRSAARASIQLSTNCRNSVQETAVFHRYIMWSGKSGEGELVGDRLRNRRTRKRNSARPLWRARTGRESQ
jgi:hypothetical protein